MSKLRVIIESPFAAPTEEGRRDNVDYARRCVKHSLMLGEAPIASHLLYTQLGILDDTNPDERMMGITAGLEWRAVAQLVAVYADRGVTTGMHFGINAAQESGVPIIYRSLNA